MKIDFVSKTYLRTIMIPFQTSWFYGLVRDGAFTNRRCYCQDRDLCNGAEDVEANVMRLIGACVFVTLLLAARGQM